MDMLYQTVLKNYFFSRRVWSNNFKKNNFQIINLLQTNLFYTENNLFGLKINLFNKFF